MGCWSKFHEQPAYWLARVSASIAGMIVIRLTSVGKTDNGYNCACLDLRSEFAVRLDIGVAVAVF